MQGRGRGQAQPLSPPPQGPDVPTHHPPDWAVGAAPVSTLSWGSRRACLLCPSPSKPSPARSLFPINIDVFFVIGWLPVQERLPAGAVRAGTETGNQHVEQGLCLEGSLKEGLLGRILEDE